MNDQSKEKYASEKLLQRTRFKSISFLKETGSTNNDLLAIATRIGEVNQVLVADHQTAGRGRLSRKWHDTPGDSLLVSVSLSLPNKKVALASFATGLAALDTAEKIRRTVQTVETIDHALFALKWPNDLLVLTEGLPKLAGILIQTTPNTEQADHTILVIGMGLNLSGELPSPTELNRSAASLRSAISSNVERNIVLGTYLQALEKRISQLEHSNQTLPMYKEKCITLGRTVTIPGAGKTTQRSAIAHDIEPSGALSVRFEDGSIESITAGDVLFQ